MKNLLIYYISILLPIPAIVGSAYYSSTLFCISLLSYAMVYRGFTDGKRLLEKGLIRKSDFWKVFVIPFWARGMYFRELYFEK